MRFYEMYFVRNDEIKMLNQKNEYFGLNHLGRNNPLSWDNTIIYPSSTDGTNPSPEPVFTHHQWGI